MEGPGVDAILSTLSGNLPQLGVGGVLAFVIGLLVKMLFDDRARHTAELDAQSKRHVTELEKKGARLETENAYEMAQHKADMVDLREELARERLRNAELLTIIDTERRARYEAEDALRGGRYTDPGRHREGPWQ